MLQVCIDKLTYLLNHFVHTHTQTDRDG